MYGHRDRYVITSKCCGPRVVILVKPQHWAVYLLPGSHVVIIDNIGIVHQEKGERIQLAQKVFGRVCVHPITLSLLGSFILANRS